MVIPATFSTSRCVNCGECCLPSIGVSVSAPTTEFFRTFTAQRANVTSHAPRANVKPAHLKFQGQSTFDIHACSVQQLQLQLQRYKTALFRYSVMHIRTLTPDRRLRPVTPCKTGQVHSRSPLHCTSIIHDIL